jgi:branched-chain amino acid transport system substrate-binding protein
MISRRTRLTSIGAAAVLAAALAAGCSSGSSGAGSAKPPILIGASLSLTGDFSDDGQAYERGYELWEHDVNAHGGLLGRKVKLVILNDNRRRSTPTTPT